MIHHFQISTNILRKYSGPVDIWLSILSAKFHLRGVVHCLLNEHPRRSLAAMAQHKSQWVWYVLPLLFSCLRWYMSKGSLKRRIKGFYSRSLFPDIHYKTNDQCDAHVTYSERS